MKGAGRSYRPGDVSTAATEGSEARSEPRRYERPGAFTLFAVAVPVVRSGAFTLFAVAVGVVSAGSSDVLQ
jgi:hypothetical protein